MLRQNALLRRHALGNFERRALDVTRDPAMLLWLRRARRARAGEGADRLPQRRHPSFFVAKLWSYFIPTAPPAATARALERLYVARDRDVRPVLEAILCHPHLYDPHRRMVKPARCCRRPECCARSGADAGRHEPRLPDLMTIREAMVKATAKRTLDASGGRP
jgi:uncharacterized protein (DUF1800 family)